MSRYFQYFPTTTYSVANSSFSMSKVITDISLKTQIIDGVPENDPYVFLPYLVREGEKPEDIADFYYNSVDYVWLVYFSNDIIDPYSQWTKDTHQFNQFLTMKYSEEAGNTDIISWTQVNTKHYKHNTTGHIIAPDTYSLSANLNPDFVAGEWDAIDYYTYEVEENDNLRAIKLINVLYKGIAEDNLRRLLND